MSLAFASSNSVGVLEFGEQQQRKKKNDGNKHDNNPLNPLSRPTRHAIYKQLEAWRTDTSVTSIVIMGSGGRHFSAGADLTEFDMDLDSDRTDNDGSKNDSIDLTDLVDYIESYPKPIVAAIRGVALGGGLELALACHYRIATPQASLGLPEVHVGVIPGAGGTQRLPRLVGIEAAIQMIITGKPVSGAKALELGLIQGLCPPDRDLLNDAAQWASWATLLPSWPRLRDVRLDPHAVQVACDAAQRKLPSLGDHGVQAALRAIRASAGPDLDEGMQVERDAFWETLNHPQGRARRYAFFAVRAAQKSASNDGTSSSGGGAPSSHVLLTPSAKIAVGVVGAGLMGSGIALVLLQAGFTVRLVDINDKALQKGVQFLRNTIATHVKRGQWSKDKADAIAACLKPSTTLQDLNDCHLVVEAVLENMNVKQQVFRTLDEVTPPEALLLSNTSTLSIDTIASALSPRRRAYCAGWHFFSPAHKMQLVEIVAGTATPPTGTTIAVLQSLTKRIGKIGVTVGNCHGFVGNRMVAPYTGEAVFLVADGASTTTTSIEAVDAALTRVFGMKMGPFAMSDLAGNDIGYYIRKEQGLTRDPVTGRVGPNRGKRRYTELVDEMVTELGRLGQKAGKGWYDYDPKVGKGRVGLPSAEFAEFIRTRYHGRAPGSDALVGQPAMDAQSIIERILFPLVNEGFKILEENVAQRPSDIDVIYVYGYGWPVWRGGPMYWADHEVGLAHLLQTLQVFYEKYPGSDWFRPSQLLETCVRSKITVEEYCKRKWRQEKSRSKL
jgi:3-hydroxyacyl-CoA dehydrogenase